MVLSNSMERPYLVYARLWPQGTSFQIHCSDSIEIVHSQKSAYRVGFDHTNRWYGYFAIKDTHQQEDQPFNKTSELHYIPLHKKFIEQIRVKGSSWQNRGIIVCSTKSIGPTRVWTTFVCDIDQPSILSTHETKEQALDQLLETLESYYDVADTETLRRYFLPKLPNKPSGQ